ncbi:MAG: hypothetical protein MJ166_05595 [Clostridia bacterium]|nr:hypothetical protein [Clostridia bacterium]
MKLFARKLALILVVAILFSICACDRSTNIAVTSVDEFVSDEVAVYYVVSERNQIEDNEEIVFSIDCNYFNQFNNSNLNISVLAPDETVIYENVILFASGASAKYKVAAADCGMDLFEEGEYRIVVTNDYNGYVSETMTTIVAHEEELVVAPDADKLGYCQDNKYINETFNLQFGYSSELLTQDVSRYEAGTMGGYSIAFVGDSVTNSFECVVLIGTINGDATDVQLEDLIEYNTFIDEPDVSSIIEVNGREYLYFEANDETTILMTAQDGDIFVLVLSIFSGGSSYADEIVKSFGEIE